jgi:hypothetical protein
MNEVQSWTAPLRPDDPLARFVLSSSHIAKNPPRVKHSAFMPPANLKLSVFLVTGLADATVWALGEQHVAGPLGRTLHARADLPVGAVHTADLTATVDDTPVRHANIEGWPSDKSAQKLLAQKLAEAAVLRLPPASQVGVAIP